MKKIFFLSFCFFLFFLISCSKVEETSSIPPFDYLRTFGGAFAEDCTTVFPLKDGTFYVLTNNYSPASNGNVPKSMHLKFHDFMKDLDNAHEKSDIWLFRVDPKLPYDKQIIYSRCFGGSGYDEYWSACLDEEENMIIGSKSNSTDGDLKKHNNCKDKCWIFKVDPRQPYDKQIVYSQVFPASEMWAPLDIESVNKDICYLFYNMKRESGNICSLMKFDFSKTNENNPVFKRNIFLNTSSTDLRSWYFSKHLSVSKDEIVTILWAVEKDKLFSPMKQNKLLNIDRTINHKDIIDDKVFTNNLDILFISLNPKLPEKDWIVFSRLIGGSKSEIFPKICKAENNCFWISCFSTSDDGDMKDNLSEELSSIAIMKINPSLSRDKQIEYSKFIHADNKHAFHSAPFSVEQNKVGFLFGIGFIKNGKYKKDISIRYTADEDTFIKKGEYKEDISLTKKQKEKNIVFSSFEREEKYNSLDYYKVFIIDTEKEKYYFQDINICKAVNGLLNPNVSFVGSSFLFPIDSCSLPLVGDMPNFKTSFIENYLSRNISLNNFFKKRSDDVLNKAFSSEIVIGKIDIKNMKEFSNNENK